jgi:uncharacterized membrane protein SirB2
MDDGLVKLVHQAMAVLSIAGFAARGAAALAGARWVRSRAARTLPHVVDSALLLSALALLALLRLNPADAPWLMAKIAGLLAYIGLGMAALRPELAWPLRAAAWVAALATVGWIASVAITKQPAGWWAGVPGG